MKDYLTLRLHNPGQGTWVLSIPTQLISSQFNMGSTVNNTILLANIESVMGYLLFGESSPWLEWMSQCLLDEDDFKIRYRAHLSYKRVRKALADLKVNTYLTADYQVRCCCDNKTIEVKFVPRHNFIKPPRSPLLTTP